MVYVRNGQVLEETSPWSLRSLRGAFWSFLDTLVLFFQSIISPDAVDKHKQKTQRQAWGGSGAPGRGTAPSSSGSARPRPSAGPRISGLNNLNRINSTPCGGGK
jgi:hypothetical protein